MKIFCKLFNKISHVTIKSHGLRRFFGEKLQSFNPNVAVGYGVAVILKEKGTFCYSIIGYTAGSGLVEHDVVLNADTVLNDGGSCTLGSFALFVEARSAEVNVVGLPFESRLAGIYTGGILAVDTAAVIGLGVFNAIGVQNLELVATVDVNAAVALCLTGAVGHIGFLPLNVDVSVAVLNGRNNIFTAFAVVVNGHCSVVIEDPADGLAFAVSPHIGVLAIEKDVLCHDDYLLSEKFGHRKT